MLIVSVKNVFFLMPGLFFHWMLASFHRSTSQSANVLYALTLFLYTHIDLCEGMYII